MSDKRTYQLEERIKRYLQDQMTGQERHAFEREMQHDQFLAEAVEGYSGISAAFFGNDLADLKKRMNKQQKGKRKYIWYVAASVIVLVVSSLILFNPKENSRQIVSENKIQQQAVPVNEIVTEKKIIVLQEQSKLKEPIQLHGNTVITEATKTLSDSATLAFNEVDKSKKPIRIRGVSSLNKQLMNAPGVETKVQPVNEKTKNQEVASVNEIQNEKALDEVVVVGYGTQKKVALTGAVAGLKTNQIDDTSAVNKNQNVDVDASPAIGWIAFKKYLKTALLTPNIGLPEEKIVVRLSFVITKIGTIEQIKVLSGKNGRYNEEAIRILIDGPKWNPEVKSQVPQRSVVKLRMVFQPSDIKGMK